MRNAIAERVNGILKEGFDMDKVFEDHQQALIAVTGLSQFTTIIGRTRQGRPALRFSNSGKSSPAKHRSAEMLEDIQATKKAGLKIHDETVKSRIQVCIVKSTLKK